MPKLEPTRPTLALTEQSNPLTEDLDAKSSLEIVEIFNHEDSRVAKAVFEARASIAKAIDWVSAAFLGGGRLIYVGAGTSGRLGVLDASECPPTFGVKPEQVQALIAGGKRALFSSVEGAEDDVEQAEQDLDSTKPGPKDVVFGISTGSTTPYVRSALSRAKERGSRTLLLTCTPLVGHAEFADAVITVLTGPEPITGSTRMKAGTATKMVLNMITTGAMVRTGRTYGNLMVDLACSNRKLKARGVRILQRVTCLPEETARKLLTKAKMHVKTALAMATFHLTREKAEEVLKENGGFLRRLFSQPHSKNPKIDAVFFDMDGTILQYDLPTGFSTWAALGWAFQIFHEMEEWVEAFLAGKMKYDDIWKTCAERIRGRSFSEVRDILFPCSGLPPYSRGFLDCVGSLRPHYKLGIVSSGISPVSRQIRSDVKLDFELSNHLGVTENRFDGTYDVKVNFNDKLSAVRAQAARMGIPLERICFIGDSPNDMEVLKAVGLPVAYNPKTPEVAQAAGGNVIGDFLQLPGLLERFRAPKARSPRLNSPSDRL